MRRPVWSSALVLLLTLGWAGPAHAEDEVLLPLPAGASKLSAYGGWLAYSVQTADGAWTLRTFHDGVEAPVAVTPREGPFDLDVGPDAQGRPTAVYSRCRPGSADQRRPTGCDLFGVTLGGGSERRLAASTRRASEFSPSLWRGSLAFGRFSAGQRKASIVLARGGRSRQLAPGALAPCGAKQSACGERLSVAYPTQMDLGPKALAYAWALNGGEVFGTGYATELRIAPLDGHRSRIADSGYAGGACGFAEGFSPNAAGREVRYGFAYGETDCDSDFESFRRFDPQSLTREEVALPTGTQVRSLAWDGDDLYWVRCRGGQAGSGSGASDPVTCELVRSRDLTFAPIRNGEGDSPVY